VIKCSEICLTINIIWKNNWFQRVMYVSMEAIHGSVKIIIIKDMAVISIRRPKSNVNYIH